MRAMLVTFMLSPDCSWKRGVYHMAKIFLLANLGIIISVSNASWNNRYKYTVRIYNPVKQSKDHDPEVYLLSNG